MMRRLLVPAALATMLLAACPHSVPGEGTSQTPSPTGAETSLGPCDSPPPALDRRPDLPPNFPTPLGVTYTKDGTTGPSEIVEGYWTGDLDSAVAAYRDALGTAGYTVPDSEHDPHDAEVQFADAANTGQIRLGEECAGRVSVTITVRPV